MRSQTITRMAATCALALVLAASAARAQAYGVGAPSPVNPYWGGTFPNQAPGSASAWTVVDAFPNLTFTDPIQLVEIPGTTKLLIAGKAGMLWTVENDPQTTTKDPVLDIRDAVLQEPDGGMLNVILHPEFGQPGSPNQDFLYIYYRYTPNPAWTGQNAYCRLSRFTMSPGRDEVDPLSEFVMIQQYDRHDWHNGGGMFFGPEDGFLYLTMGDEGGVHDEYESTQKLDDGLFGGVLRIDVDMDPTRSHPVRRQPLEPASPPAGWPGTFTQGYWIPNDNPWLDPGGSILEEFWAIGLRSPHRMTYDPVEDEIWIGDVGQGTREEVSTAPKGANLQWPYREGNIDGIWDKPNPLIGFDQPPVHDYPRSTGSCVIGGFVYRGARWPELEGKYLFADHTVRNVWALTPDGSGGAASVDFLVNVPASGTGGKNGISSFATDAAGNVYILKLFGTDLDGGKVYRLAQAGGVPDPPEYLSQLGLFDDLATLDPAPGLVPYTVNSPLWSDRAAKGRWIALPNDGAHDTLDETILMRPYGDWTFPRGTVFVKHFELPVDETDPGAVARLETRVLVIDDGGKSYGLTYRWNAAQTDARLLTQGETGVYDVALSGGGLEQQTWDFPSRTDCTTCHNANAGWVRGVSTQQLNGDFDYTSGTTDNQLRTWNHLGMLRPRLREADIAELPAALPVDAATYDLAHRMKGYLDANCAHCHRPGGVNALFDARLPTPLAQQGLVDGAVEGSYPGVPGARVIAPGDPAASIALLRTTSTEPDRMPPLATRVVHDAATATLATWIEELGADPPPALCDRDPLPVPQSGWSLLFVDSQDPAHPATWAFDDDPTTFWHTPPGGGAPGHPHELRIDLGATYDLVGLTYLQRQTFSLNGAVDDFRVYVSDDPQSWGTPVVTGSLPADYMESRVPFEATGRYVRFVADSEVAGNPWTSIAELNFLKAPCASGCIDGGAIGDLAVDAPGGSTTLSWSAPPGAGLEYDVVRADGPTGFAAAPVCVERRDTDTVAVDGDLPAPGAGFYYLVRPVSACTGNPGGLGFATDGTPRTAPLCPPL